MVLIGSVVAVGPAAVVLRVAKGPGGSGLPPPIGKPVKSIALVPTEPAVVKIEDSTQSQTTR